jgi:hypothetical protein
VSASAAKSIGSSSKENRCGATNELPAVGGRAMPRVTTISRSGVLPQ